MGWFFETRSYPSQKNGEIVAKRVFGKWTIYVKGTEQSGRFVHRMWKDAFRRTRKRKNARTIRSVLALGLGAGGEIKNMYRNFPKARITIVEHDPVMIQITKELKFYWPFKLPAIVLGDAWNALPAIKGTFDLIVVDIFTGPEPSSLLTDPGFLETLDEKLSPEGVVAINAYKRGEYFEYVKNEFKVESIWKYESNTLGLFGKK